MNQNNPLAAILVQAMQGGLTPEQALSQMAQQNPRLQQVLPLIQGKSGQQINQTAANLCRERGLNFNALANQVSQQFGGFLKK